MRLGILLLFLITIVFGGGFWYEIFDQQCKTPVQYRIGTIDDRFGTTEAELLRIVKNAELLWEKQIGEELFAYAENGQLPINLIFDERQEKADLEKELRDDLQTKEGMSDSVASQYEQLITEFRTLKKDYEKKVIVYESKLKSYNSTVTTWNNKGGVPPAQMQELKLQQEELVSEQRGLETQAKQLNNIVNQLNLIGAKGNNIITDYNEIVEEYNTRFSEVHEYTQGDHSMEAINVYQFNSEEELTLVLAHEMGHALWLDHVENGESIMNRLMEEQTIANGLTSEDVTEFQRVCKNKSFIQTLISLFQNAF